MKLRLVALVLALSLLCASFGGAFAEEKRTIGCIIGAPDAPFFKMVEDGLRAECEANGWELMVG